MTTSPGRKGAQRSTAARTEAGIAPKCTGMWAAWASIFGRSPPRKTAQL